LRGGANNASVIAMKRLKFGSIVAAIFGLSLNASAQDAHVWSDIDCAQSKIVAPVGLRCRATQEINGSSSKGFASTSAGAMFRNYTAFGSVNTSQVYYVLFDSLSRGANQQPRVTLQEAILFWSPEGKDAKNFSQASGTAHGDLLTFTSAKGSPCLGIRKFGPVTGSGYKWILYATRCDPPGRPATETEAVQFLTETGYRS
jgi:hypothetical protein